MRAVFGMHRARRAAGTECPPLQFGHFAADALCPSLCRSCVGEFRQSGRQSWGKNEEICNGDIVNHQLVKLSNLQRRARSARPTFFSVPSMFLKHSRAHSERVFSQFGARHPGHSRPPECPTSTKASSGKRLDPSTEIETTGCGKKQLEESLRLNAADNAVASPMLRNSRRGLEWLPPRRRGC